ncbi:hypothetical protein FHU38_004980 [Saccharomonospora amisosensis]|uniref:4-amino-4-deoxy-L-arabinose transferase-like glycosyltransferase n=1 Tax=Saccharomonospora amisosensis TaxID=1128677 RepID=A0A7X5UVT8_9PSEU|nr:hypothetical protein [Saccharomonospora amisosensis]NIJ14579.1 hypothetical protein [Saccharomonospora amisosensis]
MTTTADTESEGKAERMAQPAPEGAPRDRRGFLGRRDPLAWSVAALALLLGGVFVLVDLAYNQGNLIAPIDDAYIHLQYGRQLGSGHPFQYNTGDPVSTGASSLLYAFVLGAGYAIGFKGGLFLPFAVSLGIVCFAGSAAFTYRLGRLFAGRAVGVWAGVLTAVSGPLLWGAASGMEVGLTAVLLTGSVLAFTRERPKGRFLYTPVVAALLALVRPEGMFFAIALTAAMVWTIFAARKAGMVRTRTVPAFAVWGLLPVAAGVGQYLFYKLATGTFTANGVRSKSHLYNDPILYVGDFVDRTVANVRGLVGSFTALDNTDFAFPGALLLFFVGLGYLLATRVEWRPLLAAIAVGFAVVVVSASTLETALIHELRYFQPFLPLFVLFTVCGGYALTRLVPQERSRGIALHSLLLVVLLFSLAALPTWAVRLGRESATIRDTDVSVGAWINGNLPEDAIVGVKDVGAIAYFGERRVVDTIGLATNGFAEPSNNGPGSLYEALRDLPQGQRPGYFAVYEPWPGTDMQPFVDAGVFRTPALTVFPVRTPPDLNGGRIVPFTDTKVYRADWSLAGSGDRAPVPGDVRDYLNAGSLDSEAAHGYEVSMQQPGLQPYTVLRREGDVVDSGRIIVGGERFTAGNLSPGQPLTIATRVFATGQMHEVRVLVDGQDAGVWRFSQRQDGWTVDEFTVPGELVSSPTVSVELKPVRPFLSPYPEYTSFGYWFVQ